MAKNPRSVDVDTDGDGTPDITVSAFEQAANEKQHKQSAKSSSTVPASKPSDAQAAQELHQEFTEQKSAEHYRIVIPSTGREDEVKRVYVCVNGVPYTIMRDVEVVVPRCVIDALEIAKETRFRDAKDGEGNAIKVPYRVLSYPYQILEANLAPTAPAGQNINSPAGQ